MASALYYIDTEVTDFKPRDGKLVSIQWRRYAEEGIHPFVMAKEWELGSEREVLEVFNKATGFYDRKWNVTSLGWNCAFDHKWLIDRGLRYGFIEPFQNPYEYERPCVDLHHLALLMNWGHLRPEGAMGDTSGFFYDTAMSNFTRKKGSGARVRELYETRRYQAIVDYAMQEERSFRELWDILKVEMPRLWTHVIRPQIETTGGLR